VLGISSRYELDGLLKEHKIEKYTIEDFEQDLAYKLGPIYTPPASPSRMV
jgi:hypothetical protein